MNAAQTRDHLAQQLQFVINAWGGSESVEGNTSADPTGADRVRDSLAAIKAALKALGPDRDRGGTRAFLEARRDKLRSKLALFDGLGRWLRGPKAVDLIDRYVAAQAATEAARDAMRLASRENVAARRAALDLAEVDQREIEREIEGLQTALLFPAKSIIDPEVFKQARLNTITITSEPRRAVALHVALANGASASLAEALAWICYEPATGGEAFDLRWERFLAAHPEALAA